MSLFLEGALSPGTPEERLGDHNRQPARPGTGTWSPEVQESPTLTSPMLPPPVVSGSWDQQLRALRAGSCSPGVTPEDLTAAVGLRASGGPAKLFPKPN